MVLSDNHELIPVGTAGHEDSISMGCLDGAGRRLLTVAFDKTARVWDIRSGRCLAVLQHQRQFVRGCMAPHGHTVVTVTDDHVAHLWDVRSGQKLHMFQVLPSSVIANAVWCDDQVLCGSLIEHRVVRNVACWWATWQACRAYFAEIRAVALIALACMCPAYTDTLD